MRVAFWTAMYVAVAAALLSVALAPSDGGKDLERRRKLSAGLGLISALGSSALDARSPDELADSLAGYRPGCSIHLMDANGVRRLVGEERELPARVPSGQELVVERPDGGWLVWRFQENDDGTTVVASAHVPRAPGGHGRALGLFGLAVLGCAACIHAALSHRRVREAKARSPERGLVPRPRSRRALGLASEASAGLGEVAKSELLKQLVRKVRRCA